MHAEQSSAHQTVDIRSHGMSHICTLFKNSAGAGAGSSRPARAGRFFNGAAAAVQGWLRGARVLPRNVQRLQVLAGCSGVLRPGRLTLLLGPPASGKTSLLKALAGKLNRSNLEVGASPRSILRV